MASAEGSCWFINRTRGEVENEIKIREQKSVRASSSRVDAESSMHFLLLTSLIKLYAKQIDLQAGVRTLRERMMSDLIFRLLPASSGRCVALFCLLVDVPVE